MIVRNEESTIERCLSSAAGAVDEIVIADTGSTDRTKEVIERFCSQAEAEGRLKGGTKLLNYKWIDDFSAARNFALAHAESDWVLHLDADEELLGDKSEGRLGDLAANLRADAGLVSLLAAPLAENAGEATSSSVAIRLFRNHPDLRYVNSIHEQILPPDSMRVAQTDLAILHFGPFLPGYASKEKIERNTRLLLAAVAKEPGNAYYWACLGTEYFKVESLSEAFSAYRQAMTLASGDEAYAPSVLRNTVVCLHRMGHTREALASLAQLKSSYPGFTDLFYLEAQIMLDLGQSARAKELVLECLRIGDPPARYNTWSGTGTWRARELLGELEAP